MAKRVFEIARELDVTSKVVLTKCRAEGLKIKNHMSTISAGLEATIQEWFSEQATGTAVETTEHIDLKKARKEATKTRRKKKVAKKTAKPKEAPEPEAPPADVAEAPQPAELVAEAPPEPVEPEPPEVEVEPPGPRAKRKIAKKKKPKAPPKPVRPAGPQVVPEPAKLRGPRVVRVEKPELFTAPPRRAPRGVVPVSAAGTAAPPSRGKGQPTSEEAERRKKAKRRSPRRRGGRSAESGKTVREWRDQDLVEREQRLAAASGGTLRRHRAAETKRSREGRPTVIRPGRVEVEEPLTVKNLSAATGIKTAEIIKKLMSLGVLATVNQTIDRELAETVTLDYEIELLVRRTKTAEEELLEQLEARPKGEMLTRAPVVTFLGHVDHGKTSLLDRIRSTAVVEQEAGGITQHIGAYRYDKDDTHVVFLDTPGHEAFTAMRARGANMTDVVVLVVAADDGVMPQTVEAINHARAAGVPIVVALNKTDVPGANIQRAMGQLAEQDIQAQQWGGTTEVIQTSAVTGSGVEELVELLSLEAQLLELKAETDARASGFVIEAKMDPGRGVAASLLVRNGTLNTGDILLAGEAFGRVRQMRDDLGRDIEHAGPSTPVEVTGLDEVPQAGDRFYVLEGLEQARTIAEDHRRQARAASLAATPAKTLEALMAQIQAGEAHELKLIIKTDFQGSAEAIVSTLQKLGTDEVRVNVLHSAVGGITTGDVTLAEASGAIIIGFNVVPAAAARRLAESQEVDIRQYRVIYEIIEDVQRALEEGLAPEIREETAGRAEIRQTFKVSRLGTIAGCFVADGVVSRNAKLRIIRDDIVIEYDRELESLRRFKEDVREVRSGLECGLKIAGYDDIKEGDILEFYRQVEVARTL